MEDRIFLCIDLKTFYASVECVERNLDPFNTSLVVADPSRGKGTICLAISPKLKAAGIKKGKSIKRFRGYSFRRRAGDIKKNLAWRCRSWTKIKEINCGHLMRKQNVQI